MSDPRDGEPMFQIEGIPTLERMRKEHPFTLWGMEQVESSLLTFVAPRSEHETWTCMIHCHRGDPWKIKAFLWCHLDSMEELYLEWGVDVKPPFRWEPMKQAPGSGLEWKLEEEAADLEKTIAKILHDIWWCQRNTKLALAHLRNEALRIQASVVGAN